MSYLYSTGKRRRNHIETVLSYNRRVNTLLYRIEWEGLGSVSLESRKLHARCPTLQHDNTANTKWTNSLSSNTDESKDRVDCRFYHCCHRFRHCSRIPTIQAASPHHSDARPRRFSSCTQVRRYEGTFEVSSFAAADNSKRRFFPPPPAFNASYPLDTIKMTPDVAFGCWSLHSKEEMRQNIMGTVRLGTS